MLRPLISLIAVSALIGACATTPPSETPTLTPSFSASQSPSGTADSTPAATNEPTPELTPTITPGPTPTFLVSPTPTATEAVGWHWELIGDMGDEWTVGTPDFFGAAQFGYLTWNGHRTLRSADGHSWQPGSILSALGFPDELPASDRVNVANGASNGSQIVLVGSSCHDESESLSYCSPFSLLTVDGEHWTAGQFEDADTLAHTRYANYVWPVRGGWELLSEACEDDLVALWRSDDGLTWNTVPNSGGLRCFAPAVGDDGTRVIDNSYQFEDSAHLRRSADGDTWLDVVAPFLDHDVPAHWIGPVVGPVTEGVAKWLVVVQDPASLSDPEKTYPPAEAWLSGDLNEWSHADLPRLSVWPLINSSVGYVMNALDECHAIGPDHQSCPPERQAQFVSSDGLTWTRISPRLTGPVVLIDGPGGVLMIGATSGRVWRLVP